MIPYLNLCDMEHENPVSLLFIQYTLKMYRLALDGDKYIIKYLSIDFKAGNVDYKFFILPEPIMKTSSLKLNN